MKDDDEIEIDDDFEDENVFDEDIDKEEIED
jgi:hypothetical protein